jgi:Pyridoxamine 5'-phosphate oxidase
LGQNLFCAVAELDVFWQPVGMTRWGEFAAQAPDLAAFGAERLTVLPAYMATLRDDGTPRVHPVSPIIGAGNLFVFMEPTSPKGRDLRARHWYALHSGVPDMFGSGGEFTISGRASLVNDPDLRAVACEAAAYQPEERYILFVLEIGEARCNGYGDVQLPEPKRWTIRHG